MGYTPEVINSRDPITAVWGNKIEQELAKRGNYMGIVETEADLPATPATGDWYIVLDKGQIYLWNGSKWIKVGGESVNYVQDTYRIDLVDTSGVWNGIKYYPIALGEEYPQNIEVIFDVVVSSGTVQAVVKIYDYDDTLLIDAAPITVPADGQRYTYKFSFDVSSLARPNIVAAQLEVLCDAVTVGSQDAIEVRWW